MFQSPGCGHDNAHDCRNGRESHGAQRMIGQRVEHLGCCENVKANEKDVIGQQHESRKFIRGLAFPEYIVSKITYSSRIQLDERLIGGAMGGVEKHVQMSLIWGFFMINLCIVMDVIQKRMPATTMVMIPGTQPKTLGKWRGQNTIRGLIRRSKST
jgi:hypothetical protein